MTPEARIDLIKVRRLAEDFPNGDWQQIHCLRLHAPTLRNPSFRKWALLKDIRDQGGNYAFLFPTHFFESERQIHLDGPAQRKIPFFFSTVTHPPTEGLFVAYVGKASNLYQRFQWHFGLAKKSTVAQVQFGLVKSGVCRDRQHAVNFMLEHATIAFRVLSGDTQAANRDLLELSLCAKLAPPFNIKSER